jgi:PAS domain S-box-containing protein
MLGFLLRWFDTSEREREIAARQGVESALKQANAELERQVEALRVSEERFRLLVDGTRDHAIFMLDPCGRVASWNAGAERIKGYAAEEIIGQHFSRFYMPEDVEAGRPEWELAMATADGRFEEEGWRRRKDGSRFWANVVLTAMRDADGNLRGYSKITRDMTERKEAEENARRLLEEAAARRAAEEYASLLSEQREQLRARQEIEKKAAERLRLLWESAALILSSAEPETMVRELFTNIGPHFGLDVYLNYIVNETGDALRLVSSLGLPEEQVRAIAHLEFGQAICGTVARDRQAIVATHLPQSDDPKAQRVEALGIRAYICNPLQVNQELFGMLSFGSRSRDHLDPEELEILQIISQYVAVAYERLRLVGRLRDADRRKDEFLATLAHELRNPLAPIRNALELLRRTDGDTALAEEARSMMGRQLALMVRLIDDLLDVSRISRGKVQLHKQRVELANLIRSALETVRPFLESQGHELAVTLPPQPIFLEADPTRLAQVIANLMNNAAKYTEKGGHIWLTVERQDGEVVVSIRDTGIGITAEHLPHLFEMFSQAQPALERSQGGLGIGLSLVRGLVELHGGTVEAQSDGIGKGSRFIVRLPIENGQAPGASQAPAVERQVPSTGKRRILVVEDHRDAADSLATLLRMMGHETYTAYDGLEGVRAAARHRPEVVLLDIGLPKLNGHEAARQIRQQPWGKGVILIALTGWGQEEDKRRAWEAGFDHHMTKPVEPTALEELLTVLNPPASR